MQKSGYVYIMASRRNGTLYIGVTSNLVQRVYQHRHLMIDGFTRAHRCIHLVWYAVFDDIQIARHRELQMKKWKRVWKMQLIEKDNPDWQDLYTQIVA